jgi:hypothetical protein
MTIEKAINLIEDCFVHFWCDLADYEDKKKDEKKLIEALNLIKKKIKEVK